MATQGEHSIRFKPRSVVDAVIGDNAAPGGCTSLSNLIWDQSTANVLVCRPANTKAIDFSTWGSAPGTLGPVTAAFQVNGIVYGLIGVTSGAFSGLDYPFAYNLVSGAFLTVSGITAAKCPTSQSIGAWTPPQMTLTGVDLMLTHVGFDGVTHFFGWFDLTTPTTPSWNAGNTATHGLPSVPQACQTFNNRTYFGCVNVAYYTDTLAVNMTNSNQSLTVGDLTKITAMAPLPVGTTSQGIVQGVLSYKGTQLFLITGDATGTGTNGITPLGLNQLSSSVGTSAPRSVVSTPEGVRFMANDGIRDVNFFGVVSTPNDDLSTPFIFADIPSRVAAAFSGNIYRICVTNDNATGAPRQDYWYDYRRRGWTGPHTFFYDLAIGYNNDFLVSDSTINGALWNSYTVQNQGNAGNTFTENGTALQWIYTPAPMTDLDNLYANCAYRTTLEMAVPASGQTLNFTAQNESGTALATGIIMISTSQTIWGGFNWGAANWGASVGGLVPTNIPWNQNIVFNRLSIIGTGPSALGLKLGAYRVGYKHLNYILQ
jgi:hypothetical protein